MRLPEKLIVPMMAERTVVTRCTVSGACPPWPAAKNSNRATNATAPPPRPFRRATI